MRIVVVIIALLIAATTLADRRGQLMNQRGASGAVEKQYPNCTNRVDPAVGGYIIWLTAECGLYTNIPPTEPAGDFVGGGGYNGDRVAWWWDQSVNSNQYHFRNTSLTNGPVLEFPSASINNKPILNFSNCFGLANGTNITNFLFNNDLTMLFAISHGPTNGVTKYLAQGIRNFGGGVDVGRFFITETHTNFDINFRSIPAATLTQLRHPRTNNNSYFEVVTIRLSATAIEAWFNNGEYTNASWGNNFDGDHMRFLVLGSALTNAVESIGLPIYWQAGLAEFLLYDSALPLSSITNATTNMMAKYGVAF